MYFLALLPVPITSILTFSCSSYLFLSLLLDLCTSWYLPSFCCLIIYPLLKLLQIIPLTYSFLKSYWSLLCILCSLFYMTALINYPYSVTTLISLLTLLYSNKINILFKFVSHRITQILPCLIYIYWLKN